MRAHRIRFVISCNIRQASRDYAPNPDYHQAVAAGESPWTIDELLRRVNAWTLLFAPGTRFSYSNIGYLFVRQIIERATNADLNDALRILVFDPLGIEGVFVASAVEDFDAIVWGNAQRYDPRWVAVPVHVSKQIPGSR